MHLLVECEAGEGRERLELAAVQVRGVCTDGWWDRV